MTIEKKSIGFLALIFLAFLNVRSQDEGRRPIDWMEKEADSELWQQVTLGRQRQLPEWRLRREPAYFKLRADALKRMEPSEDDKKAYAGFLKQPKSDLFKLVPKSQCVGVVQADAPQNECLNNYISGGGAAYSFREKTYAVPIVADLEMSGKYFVVSGNYVLGLMAFLKDTPIESVTAQTANVAKLLQFAPPLALDEIARREKTVTKGLPLGGATYWKALPIELNTTYLMRSVAYKIKFQNSPGFSIEESMLKNDHRADVVVAFRVVRKEADGTLLILWKELQRKDSPKLEIDLSK